VNPPFSPTRKLLANGPTKHFDCGDQRDMSLYLRRYAWKNQEANIAQTYVTFSDTTLAGYYSLCASGIDPVLVPEHIRRDLPRYTVPVVLLARLAVDTRFQKQRLGSSLLKDACLRTLKAADIIGVRAMILHAIAVPLMINNFWSGFRLRFPFRSPPTAAHSTLGAACALRPIPYGNGYNISRGRIFIWRRTPVATPTILLCA